ncbi:branched chain amino acid transferase, putative [Bodo saltans]|uniref:Branched chain amino acid transferase, putative n=1 Tax=Bodo saltans TaxID=75058 RepID=A0A0S4IPR2_BODSA|nr:branched chain amino acid transferase, putative [Bodo saltans]|eukprot:CUE74209.1 branched chain amino acid transferase, putative [Bodo saltans]
MSGKLFFAKDIVRKLSPVAVPPVCTKGLGFGEAFAPHMFEVDSIKEDWGTPQINQFHNLSLPPQCSGLHYGLQCFEGLKAYRDKKNNIRLFRPEMNLRRLQNSMNRLVFPRFDEKEMLDCLKELVRIDADHVPAERGYSLYLRPTAIGTNHNLRVGPADRCKLFIITSPVGPYYPTGFKPVSLMVDDEHRRAWPGGTGSSKIGANYAGPIFHQVECAKKGYSQILWLGPGDVVDEVGAMNFMCIWKNKNGERELITAPLDGTILPGVTRDSILSLVRSWGEIKVNEQRFTIHDLVDALKRGDVEEMFGCGTAAIVSPVNGLNFKGTHYDVPCPLETSVTMRLFNTIQDIQYGDVEHEWSTVI